MRRPSRCRARHRLPGLLSRFGRGPNRHRPAADHYFPKTPLQTAPSDFLIGQPHGLLAVRGGWLFANTGTNLYDFISDQLTVDGKDLQHFLDPRATSASRSVLGPTSSPRSNRPKRRFRRSITDFVDTAGRSKSPRPRGARKRSCPETVRMALLPRGRRISRFAWVPRTFTPFVGVGGGGVKYRLQQYGSFVDFQTLRVFRDDFAARGWAPTVQRARQAPICDSTAASTSPPRRVTPGAPRQAQCRLRRLRAGRPRWPAHLGRPAGRFLSSTQRIPSSTTSFLVAMALVAGGAQAPPEQPAGATVDQRWQPWLGCWVAEEDPRRTGARAPLIVVPGVGRRRVDRHAGRRADGHHRRATHCRRPRAPGDGGRLPRHRTRPVEGARDGQMFRAATVACGSEAPRTLSSVAFMTEGPTWVEVQSVVQGAETNVRVQRFRLAASQRLADGRPVQQAGAGGLRVGRRAVDDRRRPRAQRRFCRPTACRPPSVKAALRSRSTSARWWRWPTPRWPNGSST